MDPKSWTQKWVSPRGTRFGSCQGIRSLEFCCKLSATSNFGPLFWILITHLGVAQDFWVHYIHDILHSPPISKFLIIIWPGWKPTNTKQSLNGFDEHQTSSHFFTKENRLSNIGCCICSSLPLDLRRNHILCFHWSGNSHERQCRKHLFPGCPTPWIHSDWRACDSNASTNPR